MFNGFRRLNADEIECRVSTVNDNGCSLLLYKNARVDQNLLDEAFGVFGWQRTHQLIGDRLYCTVSIYDKETGQWISKQDVGTESNTEKEKGQASDSFKRACFNLGIGRELYTAPFIWISKENVKLELKSGTNKLTTRDTFFVSDIGYDAKGNINHLVIYKNKPRVKVFTLNSDGTIDEPQTQKIGADEIANIKEELIRTGVSEDDICKRYNIKAITEMTMPIYNKCMQGLAKSRDKENAGQNS